MIVQDSTLVEAFLLAWVQHQCGPDETLRLLSFDQRDGYYFIEYSWSRGSGEWGGISDLDLMAFIWSQQT